MPVSARYAFTLCIEHALNVLAPYFPLPVARRKVDSHDWPGIKHMVSGR
jgi:hypothetical protein